MTKETVLQIKDLRVHYELDGYFVHAVDGVSFELREGECLGLVGESGSGKTTVAKSILKLLPPNAKIVGGTISIKSKDITLATEKEMDSIRWKQISLIPQSAMNALNPVARISSQMLEIFRAHVNSSSKDALEKCMQLLEMVGINRNRIYDYPHQFSGGMRQRVIIAMAVALNPDLIIGDEPTTALDVIMQAQIINLLKHFSEKQTISILLITHDISVVAEICHKIAVMYAGRVMEYGDIHKVLNNTYHPYTMGLKGAFPSIKDRKKRIISISGTPPMLTSRLSCCGFSDRCPFSIEKCKSEVPETIMAEDNHYVGCHRIQHAENFREEIKHIFATKTGY